MDLEAYKKKAQEQEDWSPGWEAIDNAFKIIYPHQKPRHYATNLKTRANLGGDQYLDGYSIYMSEYGYQHVVTYGMSELYCNEESFGGKWSGWGYEMTFKLVAENLQNSLWTLNMLANLAFFTNTQESYLEKLQFIVGDGKSLDRTTESAITGLIVTHDTEISGVDTPHGRLEFLQLVGITQKELEWIMQYQETEENTKKIQELIYRMQDDNPYLATDMKRTKNYV
ncbi:Suppressor of fused domain protein [Helicobacter didelphidarum]|uniref:Suppressor of fused domain protein n=1 Tax=Helicobacter didelphidarum TaxID=2040648 RepID=A0A3D8IM31_9HELI|nr:suppressor of fused domain protein [Helicobacter didelphidarum]RDU65704.1 Suppressor of fused domain protein [Helicobacter didelphidarum]